MSPEKFVESIKKMACMENVIDEEFIADLEDDNSTIIDFLDLPAFHIGAEYIRQMAICKRDGIENYKDVVMDELDSTFEWLTEERLEACREQSLKMHKCLKTSEYEDEYFKSIGFKSREDGIRNGSREQKNSALDYSFEKADKEFPEVCF